MGIGRKRNILRNWKKRTSNHLIINRDISTKELIQADPRSYVARAYRDWYALVSWSVDVPDEKVMVMHTLTVDPEMNGHGAGDRFIQFYEGYSLQKGSHVLRIDTNERNLNARRKYDAAGYTECGIIPCEFNGIPGVRLVCLEKVLR